MIEYLSNQSLDEVLTNDLTIVDFYADWCGPCKMMGAELEKLENIKIIKINVDTHETIAQEHGIMSIPTIEIYQNKKLVQRFIGFKNYAELSEIIKELS